MKSGDVSLENNKDLSVFSFLKGSLVPSIKGIGQDVTILLKTSII